MNSNLLREYDVDLLGRFHDFNNELVESYSRPQCVLPILSPAPPAPQSLSLNLRRHHLQAAAQLEVACRFFVSCVMSIYLSIDLSVSRLSR